LIVFFCLLLTTGDWQWPMTAEHGVTSSFGEYRGPRFHMGLDFSTNNREGEPIRPARDGRVFRVRASLQGYGRVIYISHGNGMSTVYAHLAAFGPTLREALAKKGIDDPSTPFGQVDLDLAVTTDQIIAWSGESGAGPPHLHFEVRENDVPLDPVTLDFPELPETTVGPRLDGVLLVPLDERSTVNGKPYPYFAGKGVGRVRARGEIGVRIFTHLAGRRGSRLGSRGLRLYQGERLVGEWLPRRISYNDYREAGLVLDQAFSGFGPTRFAYCFDHRADLLDPLPGFAQDGVVEVSEKTTLRIEALGFGGGWTTYPLELDPEALVRVEGDFPELPVQPTSLVARPLGNRLMVEPGIDGTLQSSDLLEGLAAGDQRFLTTEPGTSATLVWRTEIGNLRRDYGTLPESGTLTLGPWRFQTGKGSLGGGQIVLSEPADPKIEADVLTYSGSLVRFGQTGLPARMTNVQYDSAGIDKPEQVGIYTWSFNKKAWRWLGPLDEEHDLVGFVPLVAARDRAAPTIGKPRTHPYFNGARKVIPVRDKGSGIDRESVTVTGPTGPVEVIYDGDRRWLILPEGEENGPWTVQIADRAGNQTSAGGLR